MTPSGIRKTPIQTLLNGIIVSMKKVEKVDRMLWPMPITQSNLLQVATQDSLVQQLIASIQIQSKDVGKLVEGIVLLDKKVTKLEPKLTWQVKLMLFYLKAKKWLNKS